MADYILDSKGTRHEIRSYLDSGTVLSTCILPGLQTIDSMCIAPDGYIFGKWRDVEYRSSDIVDDNRVVAFSKALEAGQFLKGIDSIYGYVHPSNIASAKWIESRGGYLNGKVEKFGILYDKFIVPIEVLLNEAKKVEAKWKEKK